MKDFLYLIKRKDFCINYKKLEEYGILKFKDSYNFKQILDKNNFIENINYISLNVKGNPNGLGGRTSNDFYITPSTFKKILIRSLNT